MPIKTWEELPNEDRSTIEETIARRGFPAKKAYELAVQQNRGWWDKDGSPFEDYEQMPEDYKKASERVGAASGKSGRQIHIGFQAAFYLMFNRTPDCLRLAEGETVADGGVKALSEIRQVHVRNCGYCQNLIEIMFKESPPEHLKEFLELVTRSTRK